MEVLYTSYRKATAKMSTAAHITQILYILSILYITPILSIPSYILSSFTISSISSPLPLPYTTTTTTTSFISLLFSFLPLLPLLHFLNPSQHTIPIPLSTILKTCPTTPQPPPLLFPLKSTTLSSP